MQADHVGNNVLSGESRNRVTDPLEHAAVDRRAGTRGTYGYYSVRSNAVAPKQGLITEGDISTTNIGLFVAGRVDDQQQADHQPRRAHRARARPDLHAGADIPEFGIEFGFGDKLAPRAGFAYDINGRRQWKAFGSWGIFYDIFKLELPRGSFGGDKWLDVLLHARHLQLDDAGRQRQLPAGVHRHALPRTDRLPSPVVRRRTRSNRI